MQGRSHSLSDHSAFHRVLITFVCVGMLLLSGSPTRLAGTDWLTRQIDDRVEQIGAPNHTAVPMVLDIRFAEDPNEELVELAEPTDHDKTKYYVLRLDVAPFGSESRTGLYELSADRALTPFRLRAFPSRGSPSA